VSSNVLEEAARRRSFAIISHPDAGKTTLTEKLLLYSGVLQVAGAVKARGGRNSARSDWMEMEKQRGISVSSTVLQFPYADCVLNLLDTPGHKDFSEDTYRVLAAVDAAVMVLDSAKGIEAQTRKLFEVCRTRDTPIITFLNKQDRPGKSPLELTDEIADKLQMDVSPMLWPVGPSGDLVGLLDVPSNTLIRSDRTARGARMGEEEMLTGDAAAALGGKWWDQAHEECELLGMTTGGWDRESFLAGNLSPVFAGSALNNMGVQQLLDALALMAPPPTARPERSGEMRPLDAPFAGLVFKIQSNVDPSHRDQMAFVRVCSGRFERGEPLTQSSTGRVVTTKHAASTLGQERETIDEAFPGDVIALVNARNLKIGETVFAGKAVEFPPLPRFEPEVFASARPLDVSKAKQFRTGVEQLDAEGVIQALIEDGNSSRPIVATVGQLQMEVFQHRMRAEYNVEVELMGNSIQVARRTDPASAQKLREIGGIRIAERGDGALLALFDNKYRLERLQRDEPELTLKNIIEGP
jgi:peptide chain release factor 3